VLISYQLLPTAAEKHAIYKNSVHGVIVCLAIFNLLWLMGSEGSASLGLSQEVGIYVIVDVILKTGLGLYIVLQYGAF
jgi:bacteriorhodopsin